MIHQLFRGPRAGALLMLVAIVLVATPLAAQSRNNARGIVVYADPGFRGESATFRSDAPDLRSYALNDEVSSIEILSGETWEVCQDVHYGNRCQTFVDSVPDLRSIGWNDRISSLRFVGRGGFGGRPGTNGRWDNDDRFAARDSLVFYNRPGFRGSANVITRDTVGARSFAMTPASVEIRGGGTWELCDRYGRCTAISRDVANLSQLGLRGIDSARLLTDNRSSGRRRR
jgi:hypothetical protein